MIALRSPRGDFQCLVSLKEYDRCPLFNDSWFPGTHNCLTHSIESGQHAEVYPAAEVGGHQLELQSVGLLLNKLETHSRHRVLTPALQLGLHVTQDLCLVGLVALEVPEGFIKDDQLHITAAPEVRATAEGATLWREEQLRPWSLQESQLQEPGSCARVLLVA